MPDDFHRAAGRTLLLRSLSNRRLPPAHQEEVVNTELRIEAARRFGTVSPLRYPGGKSALAGLFADLIEQLGMRSCTYVEPYAGGAGAGVALLRQGLVCRLVINDIDPAVHAFWTEITQHSDDFLEWLDQVPLTVDEWRRQRENYRARWTDQAARGRPSSTSTEPTDPGS
jgi:DNA adenine methylase